MARDLAFGIVSVGFLLWLTFFGTEGAVEGATVIVSVGVVVWFATVDPTRLVDEHRRPHLLLFGLTLVAVALVVSAASILGTATLLIGSLLIVAGAITGLVRAVRHGMVDI